MKKLAAGVYMESGYPGVCLGAIVYSRGLLLVDTPPIPEDGRNWISALKEIKSGPERLLVNLDSHPDRVLGSHMIESSIVAQKDIAETFRQRPAIFKTQNIDTGAEWEGCSGLTGIRYKQPDIVFSEQIIIRGKDLDILVEHHHGPAKGASWVVVPERKVIFVGDAVVVKQPPFLANADLPAWIETIDLLLTKQKEYKIISGRGGLINEKHIRSMRKLLVDIHKRMERLGKRKASPEETEKMVAKILANSESPAKYKDLYSQRLKYGLYHYYARNYFPKKPE